MQNERAIVFKTTFDASASPYTVGQSNARIINFAPQDIPTIAVIVENGAQKRIRYIQGVDTIYEEEQIKRGYARDYDNRKTKITMVNGEIRCYPSQHKTLIEYLEKCPYNKSSKHTTPSSGHIFYQVDFRQKALDDVAKFDIIADAFDIINKVKKDSNKVYALGKMFNMTEAHTMEEILAHLGKIATTSPKELIAAQNSQKVGTSKLVSDARNYSVITKTASAWALTESGTKVMGFKIGTSDSEAVSKLVNYLESQEGMPHLKQIQELVDEAHQAELDKLVAQ
jgi:hypothetical protein